MKAKTRYPEFVAEQAPALGKIDAGSVAVALADAKPDAIFARCSPPTWANSCAKAIIHAACSGSEVDGSADGRTRIPGSALRRKRLSAGP